MPRDNSVISGARCPILPGGVVIGTKVGEGGMGGWLGFCQPSSYRGRRCPAVVSAVRASVALFSIMPIIRGPILISSVSLPVACLASAMCGIFCLRGPVLWLVSSYVATLFLLRAPARTAATGPLAPLVGAVARAARSGAVLVGFVNGCLQVCGDLCAPRLDSKRARSATPSKRLRLTARVRAVTVCIRESVTM